MEVWVLIVFLKAGNSAGAISQEFQTKENCERAASAVSMAHFGDESMLKGASWGRNSWAICVKK